MLLHADIVRKARRDVLDAVLAAVAFADGRAENLGLVALAVVLQTPRPSTVAAFVVPPLVRLASLRTLANLWPKCGRISLQHQLYRLRAEIHG